MPSASPLWLTCHGPESARASLPITSRAAAIRPPPLSDYMNTGSSGNSAICARVERTLAINRKAKLNFPGVFMDVIGHELDEDRIRLQFYDDPLFREGRGEVSWVAV